MWSFRRWSFYFGFSLPHLWPEANGFSRKPSLPGKAPSTWGRSYATGCVVFVCKLGMGTLRIQKEGRCVSDCTCLSGGFNPDIANAATKTLFRMLAGWVIRYLSQQADFEVSSCPVPDTRSTSEVSPSMVQRSVSVSVLSLVLGVDSLSILFNHRSFQEPMPCFFFSPWDSGGFLERFGSLDSERTW